MRSLEGLLDLVEQGCQSELEVFELQHRVRLPDGRRVFLDAAWPAARIAVEMDGHRFHSSRSDRERDMRRDAGLAVLGWVVLRYGYARLTSDPEGCRREIASVVRRRLTELGTTG